jgi:UDP-N-acetylmuramoylalanine--D-glutamate ligase
MQQGEPGDVVLLSPACASFDAYANFEQRGDAFVAAVQQAQAACANDSTAR